MKKNAAVNKNKASEDQDALKKKNSRATTPKSKKPPKRPERQKSKIVYALDNVTYYDCGHTVESFWAFSGVYEWKMREHLVFYTAEMKKGQDKKKIMPNTPFWKITADIGLVDTLREPSSRITMFDNITEKEARYWLKLFVEQSARITEFKKHYYGMKEEDLPPRPYVQRYLYAGGRDKFIKNSKKIHAESPYVFAFPKIMMTEQIFASREYDPTPPDEVTELLEQEDEYVYDPMKDVDWEIMARGLDPETAAVVKEGLKDAKEVTQIVAMHSLEKKDYYFSPEHWVKDKRYKVTPMLENTNLFRLYYFNGREMTCFCETNSCQVAVQIGLNAQDAIISPAQKAVKAHNCIKGSYAYHFKNYVSRAENIDARNTICGLN